MSSTLIFGGLFLVLLAVGTMSLVSPWRSVGIHTRKQGLRVFGAGMFGVMAVAALAPENTTASLDPVPLAKGSRPGNIEPSQDAGAAYTEAAARVRSDKRSPVVAEAQRTWRKCAIEQTAAAVRMGAERDAAIDYGLALCSQVQMVLSRLYAEEMISHGVPTEKAADDATLQILRHRSQLRDMLDKALREHFGM